MGCSIRIAGTGSYLPARVVTNDDIADYMDSSDEWIYSHTGIHSRHFAANDEATSDLGAQAAERALEAAGVKADAIGLIVTATSSPDYGVFPSTACIIQEKIGAKNAAAYDLSAACSGFVYSLEMARCWLLAHPGEKALVIGAEVLSRTVDWSDRTVSMLFGDGAGAAVLVSEENGPVASKPLLLGADGSGAAFITLDGGCRQPLSPDPIKETPRQRDIAYMKMQGRAVFNFAVKKLDEIVSGLCAKAGMKPGDLARIYAHQANERILEAVARRMELPLEKFYMNLETVGNTSGASIPLCLDKAVRERVLKDGDTIALAGFGAGLTWAGALFKWPYL